MLARNKEGEGVWEMRGGGHGRQEWEGEVTNRRKQGEAGQRKS